MSAANFRVIYGIGLSAEPFVIRYIGLTRGSAINRLLRHKKNAKSGRKSIFYDWMRKHLDEDFKIVVLENCSKLSDSDLGNREIFWISFYRNLQGDFKSKKLFKILNMSNGGINCSLSGNANPKSMLGKKHSATTKKKLSSALKNRKFSAEHRSKLVIAAKKRKLSEETKLKISNTKKGSVPWNKNLILVQKEIKPVTANSMHVRWHVNRNIKRNGCIHCDI